MVQEIINAIANIHNIHPKTPFLLKQMGVWWVVFTIYIILHEGSHYIMARRAGLEILLVGIGWGPLLIRRIVNDIELELRAIPFFGRVVWSQNSYIQILLPCFKDKKVRSRGIWDICLVTIAGSVGGTIVGIIILGVIIIGSNLNTFLYHVINSFAINSIPDAVYFSLGLFLLISLTDLIANIFIGMLIMPTSDGGYLVKYVWLYHLLQKRDRIKG